MGKRIANFIVILWEFRRKQSSRGFNKKNRILLRKIRHFIHDTKKFTPKNCSFVHIKRKIAKFLLIYRFDSTLCDFTTN